MLLIPSYQSLNPLLIYIIQTYLNQLWSLHLIYESDNLFKDLHTDIPTYNIQFNVSYWLFKEMQVIDAKSYGYSLPSAYIVAIQTEPAVDGFMRQQTNLQTKPLFLVIIGPVGLVTNWDSAHTQYLEVKNVLYIITKSNKNEILDGVNMFIRFPLDRLNPIDIHNYTDEQKQRFDYVDTWYYNNTFLYGSHLFPYNNDFMGRNFVFESRDPAIFPKYLKKDYEDVAYHITVEFTKKYNLTFKLFLTATANKYYGIEYDSDVTNSNFMENTRYKEKTYPIAYSMWVLMVPKPEPLNSWFSFAMVMDSQIWYLIISVYLIAGLVFYIIEKLILDTRFAFLVDTDIAMNLLDVFGLFTMQPISSVRKISTRFVVRTLLGLVLIMSIYYSAIFSSEILGQIIKPRYENTNDSIDYWLDTDLQFLTRVDDYLYLVDAEQMGNPINPGFAVLEDTHNSLPNRRWLVPSKKNLDLNDSKYIVFRDFPMLTTKYASGHIEHYGFNMTRLRMLPEIVCEFRHTLAVKCNFATKFNEFIIVVMDSGLIYHWEYLARNGTYRELLEAKHPQIDSSPQQLNFDHFIGVWLLLICGWALAMVSFVIESISSFILSITLHFLD